MEQNFELMSDNIHIKGIYSILALPGVTYAVLADLKGY
jgi:hypothetical protein